VGILESLAELLSARESERARAHREYGELVKRGGEGVSSKSDTPQAIGKLLKACGKSPEDLARDIQEVSHEYRQRRLADEVEAIEAELSAEIARSEPEVKAAKEAAKAAKEKASELEAAATKRRREIDGRLRQAYDARNFIANLEEKRSAEGEENETR
jgi:hypothetical protein